MAGQHSARRYLRVGSAFASAVVLAAGVVVGAQAASASITGAVLGIHGAGSLFAGTNESLPGGAAVASLATTPGGTVALPSEVINKGESLAQFEVRMRPADPASTAHLLVGSVDVSALAEGSGGYITPPLAPGKAQAMTLKITTPADAKSVDGYPVELDLYSYPGNTLLSLVYGEAVMKNTVGTTDHDLFVTSASQPTISGKDNVTTPQNGFAEVMTAPTIHVGATATFTANAKNDTATPEPITLSLANILGCASSWHVVAKAGTTDITSLIESPGGYVTAPLATGKAAKVVVTVKAVSIPDASANCSDVIWYALTAVGADGNNNTVVLGANAVP